MNVVSIREVTPDVGKEKLAELRFKRGSEILAKHGATTRLWKVIVGQGVGDLVLMSMYESFSKGATAFQSFSGDPEMAALMDERSASPAGELRGPNLFRMAYGAPTSPPRPILVQRMYHMPRKNLAQALELAPELDKLTKNLDVSIGVGLPMLATDHEMMGVVYRFNSLDHWGTAVDSMSQDPEFAALVEKANNLGAIKSSRMLMHI
tara:strand:- start:505 stop:1125 length:621 start_codon:yes stop_codon:yes gene_type:complete